MDKYIKYTDAIEAVMEAKQIGNSAYRDVNDVLNRLRLIPSADVVEVKHASLIEDGYYDEPSVCSNCGEPCIPQWQYCPVCGAKLDGKGV